jgi:hypothetical protein
MIDFPWYLWTFVLGGVVGLPVLTGLVAFRGKSLLALAFAAAWLGWTALSALLARQGFFSAHPGSANPAIPAAVVGGAALLVLASRIPAVASRLAGPAALAMPHALRLAGGAFVMAMALGQLPAVFAIPAGLGDMAVGVAVIAIARARVVSPRRLVWFNILGLLDLVVAVSLGALAAPGPLQLIQVEPTSLAVALLPLVLIPVTAVPLCIALHLVSLSQLRVPQPATATGIEAPALSH